MFESIPRRGGILFRVFLGIVVLLLVVSFWYGKSRQSDSRILRDDAHARWIVHPRKFSAYAQQAIPLQTEFTTEFTLNEKPVQAACHWEAYREAFVSVNDKAISSGQEIASLLHIGGNQLRIVVKNQFAPPALKAHVAVDGETIAASGFAPWKTSLLGSTVKDAACARDLRLPPAEGSSFVDAWDYLQPLLFAAVGLSVLGLIAGRYSSPIVWVSLLIFVALTTLYLVNLRRFSGPLGYDVMHHFDYIRHVHLFWELPPINGANDPNIETHQPPLYYVASAVAMWTFWQQMDFSITSTGILRGVNLMAAFAIVAWTSLSLRRLGDSFSRPLGMLTVASFPALILGFHYLSNDLFAGAAGAASLHFGIVLASSVQPRRRDIFFFGLAIGACVLTKLTAAPVGAAVGLCVAASTLDSRRRFIRMALLPGIIAVLMASFFFVRNKLLTGHFVIGSYDPGSGHVWWQDPGYVTLSHFTQFGSFVPSPREFTFSGFLESLYLGFQGDSGPAPHTTFWNRPLVRVMPMLGLIPLVLGIVGWFTILIEWILKPRTETFLVVSVPVASLAGVTLHYLNYPYFCHTKGVYLLPAASAAAICVARGFQVVTWNVRLLQFLVGVLLGFWMLASLSSLTIRRDSIEYLIYRSKYADKPAEKVAFARAAVEAAPHDPDAHLFLGLALIAQGERDTAEKSLLTALELEENSSTILHALAEFYANHPKKQDQGLPFAERAAKADPDNLRALIHYVLLAEGNLSSQSSFEPGQLGIGVAPTEPLFPFFLARVHLAHGQVDEALARFSFLEQYQEVPALFYVDAAWIRVAHRDERYRNLEEARRLQKKAEPFLEGFPHEKARLDAAILAASGDFQAAQERLETLVSGDSVEKARRERDLAEYKSLKPLRLATEIFVAERIKVFTPQTPMK